MVALSACGTKGSDNASAPTSAADQSEMQKYNAYVEKQAIPRYGRSDDIARAVVFFLEPDNYVTGQVLTVDGGLSLKM